MTNHAKAEATLINQLGLHARAASKLIGVTSGFAAEITISTENKSADGKRIMNVMMLAAGVGTPLVIEANGDDAQAAVDAVVELINNRFGESE